MADEKEKAADDQVLTSAKLQNTFGAIRDNQKKVAVMKRSARLNNDQGDTMMDELLEQTMAVLQKAVEENEMLRAEIKAMKETQKEAKDIGAVK